MKYLTIEELSHYLKISKSTIYIWVEKKFVPYIKLNQRVIRFDIEKINSFMMEHAIN
jgi:excisionase family DNA binding protein